MPLNEIDRLVKESKYVTLGFSKGGIWYTNMPYKESLEI